MIPGPSAVKFQFPKLFQPPPAVLFVDDNRETREMYAAGLQVEGFHVRSANDGRSALDAIDEHAPDCIVTDVRMPRMNGLELRRALQHDERTSGLPVIALTGIAPRSAIADLCVSEFDAVLLKPCVPEVLAVHIVSLLLRRRGTGTQQRSVR